MGILKKCFVLSLVVGTFLTTTPICANEGLFEGPQQEAYSFELTDKNQKRVAVGMTIWGIVMTIVTVVVVAIVPNSSSPTAERGDPKTGGGGLF